MPFVSYAQNFEDLMLWRALKHIQNGFYVDVGACDPVFDSVTKVFYDAGWSGVNIEPDPRPFERLQLLRPRDVNLNVGAADRTGIATLDIYENVGLSTLSSDIASKQAAIGRIAQHVPTQLIDLRTICTNHVEGREIHFMKVDTEGTEEEVFRGHDFTRWRPWIILFEASGPDPTTTFHETVERLIVDANYRYVWFDGLNRWYAADERSAEVSHAFRSPPNFFDDWIRYNDIRWAPRGAFPGVVTGE